DFHVTGVQTCALPISAISHTTLRPQCSLREIETAALTASTSHPLKGPLSSRTRRSLHGRSPVAASSRPAPSATARSSRRVNPPRGSSDPPGHSQERYRASLTRSQHSPSAPATTYPGPHPSAVVVPPLISSWPTSGRALRHSHQNSSLPSDTPSATTLAQNGV